MTRGQFENILLCLLQWNVVCRVIGGGWMSSRSELSRRCEVD